MATFFVQGLIHASVGQTVDADTPEQAANLAELHGSLCHQCSDELELGDIHTVIVIADNGRGDIVYRSEPDTYSDAITLANYLGKSKRKRPPDIAAIVKQYVK